jgi:hypothetical protein
MLLVLVEVHVLLYPLAFSSLVDNLNPPPWLQPLICHCEAAIAVDLDYPLPVRCPFNDAVGSDWYLQAQGMEVETTY